ncbi:MAG: hypothetical protein QOH60_5104 [Mycobacterium sp.]|jgi:hypothetical protein|nr:hypothetical protein [Mycobacterium sp.]
MKPITANSLAHMNGVGRLRGPIAGASAALAAMTVMAGCSSTQQGAPSSPTNSSAVTSAPPPPAGQSGVSPNGVTTSVSAPSGATEEEFFQACHFARVWMTSQPGDPHAQIEPYLAMVQASPTGEDGTWQTPWAKLTPERQAGVILAAHWAADDGCG